MAFDAGVRLSESIGDGQTSSILYAPSVRTRETAEELALGLALGLRSRATSGVRIGFPRAEPAICNFHFLVDGQQLPPTDTLHPSFPAAAEQDPYLMAFWSAKEDRVGYWMSHPSERVESPAAVGARLTFSSSHCSTPLSRTFPCSSPIRDRCGRFCARCMVQTPASRNSVNGFW